MLESFVHWLLERFRDLGYPGIVILMAMESSVLPVPSELVMPPAGYLAAKGELNLVVAIACGVLGSVLGALANYGVALWLGGAGGPRLGGGFFLCGGGAGKGGGVLGCPWAGNNPFGR